MTLTAVTSGSPGFVAPTLSLLTAVKVLLIWLIAFSKFYLPTLPDNTKS